MPTIKNAGRYAVTAQDAGLGQSEKKGTPYLAIEFATDTGDTLDAYLYLSPAALPYTLKTLREVFGFNDDFESVIAQVKGKPASIVVDIENYEGKDRAKVQYINSPGREAKPISDVSSLLSSLTAAAKRIPVAAPKASPSARPTSAARPPAARPAPSIPDDDVPF